MQIEDRKGLVRGVVEVRQDHGSFVPIKAYTFWYRHDEPDLEEKIQNAIEGLERYYMRDHWRCSSLMMYLEWVEYKK